MAENRELMSKTRLVSCVWGSCKTETIGSFYYEGTYFMLYKIHFMTGNCKELFNYQEKKNESKWFR